MLRTPLALKGLLISSYISLSHLGFCQNFTVAFFDHSEQKLDKQDSCVHLNELLVHAQTESFESQEAAEKVFQARHQIGVSLGQLTPQLSIGLGAFSFTRDVFQVVSSLVGFVYPSNWYNWKTSRRLYETQRYSYMTLLANHQNILTSLYLNIHMQMSALKISRHYYNEANKSIAQVNQQIAKEGRNIDSEMMGILKSIRSRIRYDMEVFEKSIRDMLPQLANAANFDTKWSEFCIQPIDLHTHLDDFSHEKSVRPRTFLTEALFKSTELASLEFAYEAAKSSRTSYAFRFINPEDQKDNLGLSYFHEMKIRKSKLKEIQIEMKKTRSNIKTSLFQTLNAIRASERFLKQGQENIKALNGPKNAFIENVNNLDSIFDLEKPLRFFEYSLAADLRINHAIHLKVISLDNFHRLLWKNPRYTRLLEKIPPQKLQRKYHRWWL